MKNFLRTTVVTLLILVIPASVAAHGSIYTFKYIDGSNLITVTHNVHDAQAGAPITYHLRLQTLEGGTVLFQDVIAEVKRGDASLKRQTMSDMPSDNVKFTYTYPESGNYMLHFAFIDNGKQVAHGEFPIVVAEGASSNFFAKVFTVYSAIAFLLGAGAVLLFQQRGRIKFLKRG